MKTVKLYEEGEEVMVVAQITGIVVENGEIKYKLKNPLTGREYGYLFTEDQLVQKMEESKPKEIKPFHDYDS